MTDKLFDIGPGRCISIAGNDSVYVSIVQDKTTRYAIGPAYADDLSKLIVKLLNESPEAQALAVDISIDNARTRRKIEGRAS